MFISMALAALCNLLASFMPQWHALLAARALEGLLLGGVPAAAMAYLSEEIDPPGLGFAMGLYGRHGAGRHAGPGRHERDDRVLGLAPRHGCAVGA